MDEHDPPPAEVDPVTAGGRVADRTAERVGRALATRITGGDARATRFGHAGATPIRAANRRDAGQPSIELPVISLIRETAADVERVSSQSPDAARRACRAGCDACCRLAVSVTAPEAIWIAHELRCRETPASLAALRAKIQAAAARVSELTIEQRALARIPCALLGTDGACTIHPFRPFGCRGWTSFSKEACDAALKDHIPGHDGSMDRIALAAASGATEGVVRGMTATGAAGGTYEFHAALLRALECPDAAERWPQPPDLMAGCPRVRSERLRWPAEESGSGRD